MLVLVLSTLAAAGYLYLSRGSGGANTGGFLGANQQAVKAAGAVVAAAGRVQRFTELGSFDTVAFAQQRVLAEQRTKLRGIAAGASGRQQQIAGESVASVGQAIDAVGRYRKAVSITYRLSDADTALQDLTTAVASLQQQAQTWQHS